MQKKAFVSGCYDLLHSGHVEFFQQASRYGDLYVGIGSDATYLEYKHRKPMFSQEERLFMVKNIKAVKDAYINEGRGVIDFLPTLDKVKPDVFVVNAEGGSDEKRRICKERGIEYVELQRTPHAGLKARSSSGLKKALSNVSENSAQEASVQPMIDRYSNMEEVLAWKMPGAGGGGYLALVVKDSLKFAENHDEAIHLQIRRA